VFRVADDLIDIRKTQQEQVYIKELLLIIQLKRPVPQ